MRFVLIFIALLLIIVLSYSDGENMSYSEIDKKTKLHELSTVKKTIAVIGGKGGVGKSTVTSMLAVTMQRRGLNTAILDADITGASVPHAFGLKGTLDGTSEGVFPMFSKFGIQIVSMNLLLSSPTDPVVWRGAALSSYVRSFRSKIIWTDVDVMFIDMPPGTGEVPLTVLSEFPIDGIVVVITPQKLACDVAEKAVKMAKSLNIPILGLVENQSYFICSDCKKKLFPYGESSAEEFAEKFAVPLFTRIPVNRDIALWEDRGLIELFEGDYLDLFCDGLEKLW